MKVNYKCVIKVKSTLHNGTTLLYIVSIKNKTPNSCPYLRQIWMGFHIFHRYAEQEICNKMIIADPTTPQRCRYTTM